MDIGTLFRTLCLVLVAGTHLSGTNAEKSKNILWLNSYIPYIWII